MEDTTEKKKKEEMSFLDHLEDLRWHLIKSAAAILVGAVLAFIFKNIIFDVILIAPKMPDFFTNRMFCALGEKLQIASLCINSQPFNLISIKMAGQFQTHITVALVAGIVLAFPYVFYQIWSFVRPALHDNEKKYSKGIIFWSSFLFIAGIMFGYYLICPLSVHFLGSYQVSELVRNEIAIDSYISTIVSATLASGVVFELPIVIFFLAKVGLVTPEFLRKYRKHAFIVILVLAAVITPPDVFSQILVTLPLMILYEVSIVLAKRVLKNKAK